MNYIGTECLVCKKKFVEEDDIVVCEVCGTPYHRDCYSKVGRCTNDEYHSHGWTFQQKSPEPSTPSDSAEPTPVGVPASPTTNVDAHSASDEQEERQLRLIDVFTERLRQSGVDPDEEVSGVTLQEFYLYTKSIACTKQFYRVRNGDYALNVLAILFPELYMAGKKQYAHAAMIALFEFALSVPLIVKGYPYDVYERLTSVVPEGVLTALCWVCLVLLCTFKVFVSSNCIKKYYQHSVKTIRLTKLDSMLKGQHRNVFLRKLLTHRAGNNVLAMFILLSVGTALYFNLYVLLTMVLTFL